MNYELLVDKLMQHFTSGKYSEEVKTAKKEFFDRAGMFDENSHDFEMKMAQFSDWYIFNRALQSVQMTPLTYVLEKENDYKIEEELRPYYENLRNSVHSLFEFLKLKGEDLHIKDLITNQKYILKKSPMTIGFNKDEYFESRLIPHEDNYIFGKSFCFHPPSANRFINKEIKRVKKAGDDVREGEKEKLIIRIFKMRYKHEQYKHVEVKEIYSNDSKLRL